MKQWNKYEISEHGSWFFGSFYDTNAKGPPVEDGREELNAFITGA